MICPSCTAARMKWLDSKPSTMFPEFGIAYGSGASHDVSVAGLRDRARGRHERWRRLVNDQMALIAAACKAAEHVSVPSPPVVVQLDLFDPIEVAA